MSIELVCLVADKCIEAALDALLSKRAESLGIRRPQYEIRVHPDRDPGCYRDGAETLVQLMRAASKNARGLLIFDHAWDGNPHRTASETADALRRRLEGANDRAEVIVLDPEVEVWIWASSPHVAQALGWSQKWPDLRRWLTEQALWPKECPKPPDPKRALKRVLRHTQRPFSSAIFRAVAELVSLKGCKDPAFLRLSETLRRWFPVPPSTQA